MAVIPPCRADVPTHVWPEGDTLICDPSADIASHHLTIGAAAQAYGQNSYRIRQPFDFKGRTGKIVFDGTVNKLSPLNGWLSLAITQDPMGVPGYAILGNAEGSVIPRNAIEVQFSNYGGEDMIAVNGIHVFHEYVDTFFDAITTTMDRPTTFRPGKMNHFEVLVSEQSIEVKVTPSSDDGITFGAPVADYTIMTPLPFSQGYVQVSAHNHAMLKYTLQDTPIDATVAQVDNVGFDGPIIGGWREYEVPDSLVKFTHSPDLSMDPYNPDQVGYDIGYIVQDVAVGPKQVFHLSGVDTSNVTSAKLAFSAWVDFGSPGIMPAQYTYRARLNGKAWREHMFTPVEAAFHTNGPTVIAPDGGPVGTPGSQGRLALQIDVPPEDLVDGDNTLEFVTANIPTSYPPGICNVDLVLTTN
jgi:hypothetical protein